MTKLDRIKKTLIDHKNELREKYGITEIGIFGSYVRGEQKRKSDIDILVNMKETISLLEWAAAANYLSDLLKIKVDLVPRQDIRPELREIIIKEVLYL